MTTKDEQRASVAALFSNKAVTPDALCGEYVGIITKAEGRKRTWRDKRSGEDNTAVSASMTITATGKRDGTAVTSAVLKDLNPVYYDFEMRRTTDIQDFADFLVSVDAYDNALVERLLDAYYGDDYDTMTEVVSALCNAITEGTTVEFEVALRRKISDPKYPFDYRGLAAR